MKSTTVLITILAITELDDITNAVKAFHLQPVKATFHLAGDDQAIKGTESNNYFSDWPAFSVVHDNEIEKSCVVLEAEADPNWGIYNFEGWADILTRYYGPTQIECKDGVLASTFDGDNKKPVTPQLVVFVEGGVVTGAISNVPIEVIVYDRDNIVAGDPEPINEDEARKTMQEVL